MSYLLKKKIKKYKHTNYSVDIKIEFKLSYNLLNRKKDKEKGSFFFWQTITDVKSI